MEFANKQALLNNYYSYVLPKYLIILNTSYSLASAMIFRNNNLNLLIIILLDACLNQITSK